MVLGVEWMAGRLASLQLVLLRLVQLEQVSVATTGVATFTGAVVFGATVLAVGAGATFLVTLGLDFFKLTRCKAASAKRRS